MLCFDCDRAKTGSREHNIQAGEERERLETVRHVNNRNEKAPIHTQEILFRNESCFEKCRMRIQFKFGSIYISIVR